jgi:hypothetical protein
MVTHTVSACIRNFRGFDPQQSTSPATTQCGFTVESRGHNTNQAGIVLRLKPSIDHILICFHKTQIPSNYNSALNLIIMAKVLVDSKYPGIKVKEDPSDTAHTFLNIVNGALDKIASKPVGEALLNNIASDGVTSPTIGYKVCIVFPQSVDAGNKCVRISETNAHDPTKGTGSAVYFNYNIDSTPDTGPRPPFIGLAHELVHAWHNLNGVAKRDTKEEEFFTVGIPPYDDVKICENLIRLEHKLPIRFTYEDSMDRIVKKTKDVSIADAGDKTTTKEAKKSSDEKKDKKEKDKVEKKEKEKVEKDKKEKEKMDKKEKEKVEKDKKEKDKKEKKTSATSKTAKD